MNFSSLRRGMGIGGWLTNYKRFNVLPEARQFELTVGDFEHFAAYITREDIAYLAELGMDHVRLGFDQIVLEAAPGQYREETFAHIDRFLEWCREFGLYPVLNLHKAVGNYCDVQRGPALLEDAALQERFIALWQTFERRYHGIDAAFELLNEVRDVPPEDWNRLAGQTLAALRAENSDRVVIIGSTDWNSPKTLRFLRQYDDPYVVYTFHQYEPFEFTHQRGVLVSSTHLYNREMPYPGEIERYRDFRATVCGESSAYPELERMDRRYLEQVLRPAIEFRQQHPQQCLWCGEFGTIRHICPAWRENWMRDMIAILTENGISYCVWNYLSTPYDGNRFSLVDDDTRRILTPGLAAVIRGEG